MDGKISTDFLLAEYLQLQKTVEDFDAKALTIKAWSVTVSAAGVVAAYVESKPMILVVAGVTAIAFWLVEALWKANQHAYYPRIKQIEAYCAGSIPDIRPLQVGSSWTATYRKNRRELLVLHVATWPHVWLPHLPVALCAFILWSVAPPLAAFD